MNGRIARKLRKLSNFEPSTKRHYFCTNNANNFVLGNNGEPERIGGTIIEALILYDLFKIGVNLTLRLLLGVIGGEEDANK